MENQSRDEVDIFVEKSVENQGRDEVDIFVE